MELACGMMPSPTGSGLMPVGGSLGAYVTLSWLLTRSPGYSFFAAVFYSLLAPAQILAPDGAFSWANFFSPHRFMLQAIWDETPRCAALTFLLLFILFLARWIETRRPVYAPAAAIAPTTCATT
jgi:hypothetical protein